MSTPGKTRVAVVFGGGSTEHTVSSVGAADLLGAIGTDEFEIVPIGITHEGRWVLTGRDAAALDERAVAGITQLVPAVAGIAVVDARDGVGRLAGIDVVFPVLHGVFGEEGTLQGLLEMADLPYVGSGVFASVAAMDHDITRKLAVAAGLPVTPYVVLHGPGPTTADRERLGLPVLVRPARSTAAAGVGLVEDWAELPAALAAARTIDVKVLVTSVVTGRRVTVGVLEGDPDGDDRTPRASVPGEFVDGDADLAVPADLPPNVEVALRELAVRAFEALDCAGLARVDFTVTPAGEVFMDGLATMPGIGPESVFARVWGASGVQYRILVSTLIRTALRRGTGLH